jgi:hypothetical protein
MRFELNNMVQTLARTEPTEVSHEASDYPWIRGGRLLAAATTMPRSHSLSTDHPVAAANMMPPQTAAGANKLPIEEFEDLSLVYSTGPKR